jgi:molybdopterin-synthase adenylyltransferase
MNDNLNLADEQQSLGAGERATVTVTPPLILRCKTLKSEDPEDEASPEDRQERVPGFSQDALSNLTVLIVGAGALGGTVAEGLVRKGVGTLKILDFDIVSLSNLNRQFFFPRDVYKPKAWALARNLAPHGVMGTRIIAHNLRLKNAQEGGVDLSSDVIVSAVDDDRARIALVKLGLEQRIPVVFGGASRTADFANLFVQEVDGACFVCAFPDVVDGQRVPCPGSPAIKDLFMQMGGLMVYAIDTLFMERPRTWNRHTLCPRDAAFTESKRVERRPDCPICGDVQ